MIEVSSACSERTTTVTSIEAHGFVVGLYLKSDSLDVHGLHINFWWDVSSQITGTTAYTVSTTVNTANNRAIVGDIRFNGTAQFAIDNGPWFLDPTPGDDSEFSVRRGERASGSWPRDVR